MQIVPGLLSHGGRQSTPANDPIQANKAAWQDAQKAAGGPQSRPEPAANPSFLRGHHAHGQADGEQGVTEHPEPSSARLPTYKTLSDAPEQGHSPTTVANATGHESTVASHASENVVVGSGGAIARTLQDHVRGGPLITSTTKAVASSAERGARRNVPDHSAPMPNIAAPRPSPSNPPTIASDQTMQKAPSAHSSQSHRAETHQTSHMGHAVDAAVMAPVHTETLTSSNHIPPTKQKDHRRISHEGPSTTTGSIVFSAPSGSTVVPLNHDAGQAGARTGQHGDRSKPVSGKTAVVASDASKPGHVSASFETKRLSSSVGLAGHIGSGPPPAPVTFAGASVLPNTHLSEGISATQQQDIIGSAASLAFGGGGSAKITMHPASLGSLVVTVNVNEQGVTRVHLEASTDRGLQALASTTSLLAQHLASAGMVVGSVQASIANGNPGQGSQGSQMPTSGSFQGGQNAGASFSGTGQGASGRQEGGRTHTQEPSVLPAVPTVPVPGGEKVSVYA